MAKLPPVPVKEPLIDPRSGLVTNAWASFFRELWNRAGGATGQSTTELEATAASLQTQITALSSSISDIGKGRAL